VDCQVDTNVLEEYTASICRAEVGTDIHTRPHGVIKQMKIIDFFTAVRTSNLKHRVVL
jgi:hypothetical protein